MEINKNKLILAMARGKYSVATLSKVANVGRGTLSGLKSGRVKTVEPATVGKLAEALEVDVTELIGD